EIAGIEALRRALHALMSETIVRRAFLSIAENTVGLGRLFEFFLGRVIARIYVGVTFPRELTVCALDLLIVCVPAYPEDFVVISLRHGHGSASGWPDGHLDHGGPKQLALESVTSLEFV